MFFAYFAIAIPVAMLFASFFIDNDAPGYPWHNPFRKNSK